MDPGADAPGSDEAPKPSPSSPTAAAGTESSSPQQSEKDNPTTAPPQPVAVAAVGSSSQPPLSRYESQKKRDWNTFLQYLKNHKPPLALARCSGAHVIEFLKYLDQFGKTKVHVQGCNYFGHPNPPQPCACPLRQAWGSLDALIGRLRAAYEENGGKPESNPFGTKAVRIYLREVRESQAKARGIPYEKKKRKRQTTTSTAEGSSSTTSAMSTTTVTATATTTVADTTVTEPAAISSEAPKNGDDGSSAKTEEGSGTATKPGGDSSS